MSLASWFVSRGRFWPLGPRMSGPLNINSRCFEKFAKRESYNNTMSVAQNELRVGFIYP